MIPQAASQAAPPNPVIGVPAWLRYALVVAGTTCLAALLFGSCQYVIRPALRAAQASARASQCQANLRQIAAALHRYHEQHGNFPPPFSTDDQGRPLHSWRVLILPYLGSEAQTIYQQLDLSTPWNSPQNQAVAATMPSVYRCPDDTPLAPGDTSYCAVVGPGFVFQPGQPRRTDQIRDGLQNTLLVVEISNSQINWLEPKDINPTQLALGLNSVSRGGMNSQHEGGTVGVAFADGQCAQLSEVTSPEELHAMATIAGGEPVNQVNSR
jgi:hypothetical protein